MTDSEQRLGPQAIALGFAGVLDRLGIPYLVGGSMASSVYGEPRSTLDVDVVADLRPLQVAALVRALERDYYVDADAVESASRGGTSFNAIHLESGIKVDLFVAGDDPFEHERLRNRVSVHLGPSDNDRVFVDTAEHTLLRKLEWFRRGGEVSDRQWRDVVAIVRVQGDGLDRERLERWAEVLGVGDLLRKVLGAG